MSSFFGVKIEGSGPERTTPIDEKRLLAAIDVLRPKPCPFPLLRIGGDSDGSYLLPDDLAGISACFSPGVNNTKIFEDHLADQYGIASHMCDKSSDPEKFRTPLKEGKQTFIKKWLDINGGDDSISLQEWVETSSPDTNDLLLQIDIEGAEYRNLLETPREILRRFRIIVIELHRLNQIIDPATFAIVFEPFLNRLDQDFICVHAHPNNCCGEITVPGIGINIPKVHELTFLRRDRLAAAAAGPLIAPVLPHPLDIRSNAPRNPPLFLNEAWFDSSRPAIAWRKMLEDECAFERGRNWEIEELSVALATAYRISQRLHGQIVASRSSCESTLDVAAGKPFFLSSNYLGRSLTGLVSAKVPFFFHTQIEARPFVMIDLQTELCIGRIEIANRTNGNGDRASTLFATIHYSEDDKFTEAFPLNVDPAFVAPNAPDCVTYVGGRTGRYLTIFSLRHTALHLSAIRAFPD